MNKWIKKESFGTFYCFVFGNFLEIKNFKGKKKMQPSLVRGKQQMNKLYKGGRTLILLQKCSTSSVQPQNDVALPIIIRRVCFWIL